LISTLAGGEWSASRPGRLIAEERAPGTHWIGGWVDPRAGLEDLEKRNFLTLPGLELRHLGRPARSRSLYRLSYTGSSTHLKKMSSTFADAANQPSFSSSSSSCDGLGPMVCSHSELTSNYKSYRQLVGLLERGISPMYTLKQKQKNRGHIPMPRVGFEPTIPVFIPRTAGPL
jgi:hypothetical protein